MVSRKYEVLLTQGAEQDLESIFDYIAEFDCRANAELVLDGILQVGASLATHPERGTYPRELLALGIREYRQVLFKPYRVIYRIRRQQVVVYVIADSRRDLQALLARRFLGA